MFPNQQIHSPAGMFVPEVLCRQLNLRVLCLGSAFAVCSGTAGWLGAFANVLAETARAAEVKFIKTAGWQT